KQMSEQIRDHNSEAAAGNPTPRPEFLRRRNLPARRGPKRSPRFSMTAPSMSARLLRQKPLAQNYPSTEEIIAACTAILSAKCTPEAQPAPQPEPANTVSAIADALPQPGLALQT